MQKQKRNQIFNYLFVLAIMMVIDDHVSSRIGFLTSIFPYNSFYMPLFVFASGYFYKKARIIDYTKHKVKKLLVPYLIWNVLAAIFAFLLDKIFEINWIKKCSLKKALITIFTTGSLTTLNGAAWFVIMLFWIQIIYNLFHHRQKDKISNDIIETIIYILLGFLSLYLCMKGYPSKSAWWLFALKITFYFQFFHLGTIFKKYIEKALQKANKLVICIFCIIINVLLICCFGDKINFYATSNMSSFNSWYLPIVTSITGIAFYYEIMSFLSSKIGENKLINFISRNTFVILETHLLFLNIPNFYIYLKIKNGSTLYRDFNLSQFIDGAWVRYSLNSRLIGFFLGVFGSLIIAYFIEKTKEIISEKMPIKKSTQTV